MVSLLKKIWDFDFLFWNTPKRIGSIIFASLIISGLVFIIGQIVLGGNALNNGFTFINFIDLIKNGTTVSEVPDALRKIYPYLWITLAGLFFISALTIYIVGYFESIKLIGHKMFNRYFVTFNLSFVIGSLLILAISGLFKLMGFELSLTVEFIGEATHIISAAIGEYIPTVFQLHSYWLAVIASICFATLPSYVGHRLCHEFRFFWLVCHRGHHAPKFLHPLAAPQGIIFDFLLVIPAGVTGLIISKLIYTEPLVMEMALWFTASIAVGPLSHSSALYEKSYNNKFIRFLSLLYGDGLYHMMHHSAKPGDETINLVNSPFLLWDRVFGTYKGLYQKCPNLGLNNSPEVHLNPFRILFSGLAQLAYEWRSNKDWSVRFQIIFGSIWYKPPVTKDYLLISNEDKHS